MKEREKVSANKQIEKKSLKKLFPAFLIMNSNSSRLLSEELLEIAFRKARKKAGEARLFGKRIDRIKNLEIVKVKESSQFLIEELESIVKKMPSFESLHPFYRETMQAIVDLKELKQALGQLSESAKVIKKIRFEAIGKLKAEQNSVERLQKNKKEAFGRIASVVKRAEKSLQLVREAGKKFKELPVVKFDCFTAVLAGFPNTGKTTILERLTGSKAQIASYPFTTKSVKIGYFVERHRQVQVLDTPGLLDREEKKRNAIERKAINALKLLEGIVVFVADASEQAYSIEEQKELLERLQKEMNGKKFLVVLNKADSASKEQLEKARQVFEEQGKVFVEGKEIKSKLKETLIEMLHNLGG